MLELLAVSLRPPERPGHLEACLSEIGKRVEADPGLRVLVDEAAGRMAGLSVEREYHRLFLGPRRPLAPPFESVYADGVAFGPSAVRLLAELREAGLEPSPGFRLPPDHVAVELEYLAHLVRRAEDAAASGDRDAEAEWRSRARGFSDGHLNRWLPQLLRRLASAAPGSPYESLVRAAAKAADVPVAEGSG